MKTTILLDNIYNNELTNLFSSYKKDTIDFEFISGPSELMNSDFEQIDIMKVPQMSIDLSHVLLHPIITPNAVHWYILCEKETDHPIKHKELISYYCGILYNWVSIYGIHNLVKKTIRYMCFYDDQEELVNEEYLYMAREEYTKYSNKVYFYKVYDPTTNEDIKKFISLYLKPSQYYINTNNTDNTDNTDNMKNKIKNTMYTRWNNSVQEIQKNIEDYYVIELIQGYSNHNTICELKKFMNKHDIKPNCVVFIK